MSRRLPFPGAILSLTKGESKVKGKGERMRGVAGLICKRRRQSDVEINGRRSKEKLQDDFKGKATGERKRGE